MSEIKANTISNLAGTGPAALTGQEAAKAWLNYNQVTPVVNNSFNTTSVTDNGVGDFTQNFTNTFTVTTYSTAAVRSDNTLNNVIGVCAPSEIRTTSSEQFYVASTAGAVDSTNWTQHFGDIA